MLAAPSQDRMTRFLKTRLLNANDPALRRLILLDEEAEARRELDEIVESRVLPVVYRVIDSYTRPGQVLDGLQRDEIASAIVLRVIERLHAVRSDESHAIGRLDEYVVVLSNHAVSDELRERHPRRARLRNQLRYVLARSQAIASWHAARALVCGRAEWTGRTDVADPFASAGGMPADDGSLERSVLRILDHLGAPVRVETLLSFLIENTEEEPEEAAGVQPSPADAFEIRESIFAVWREILELQPQQRAALLLNLREASEVNVISLLILANVATFEEVAEAAGLTPVQLEALWPTLPIPDADIAVRLGVTRQQVINLRKAARERLARRLARLSKPGGKDVP